MKLLAITLILIVCIPFVSYSKPKPEKRGKVMIDSNILKQRYSNFSTSKSLILLKIKNANKEIYVITNNTSWFRLCLRQLELIKDEKEYVSYMIKNYDKTFEVPFRVFEDLRQDEAELPNFKEKTWAEIKAVYLVEKGPGLYQLKNPQSRLDWNMSFLRLLLEQNVTVCRGSYDGTLHISDVRM